MQTGTSFGVISNGRLALDFARQIAPAGSIDIRRFFGGSVLVRNGAEFEADGCGPFSYRAAGREVMVRRCYAVPAQVVDDPVLLHSYAERALRATPTALRRDPGRHPVRLAHR